MNKLWCGLLISLGAFTTQAQVTGSFETTIWYNNTDREIALYVPQPPANNAPYKIVLALHGCGGGTNANGYRTRLIPVADSIGSIVICPQGEGQGFMGDPASLPFLARLVDSIAADYSVDQQSVYLTGFSCNGYTTLYAGMRNYFDFKGIIPFNAALFNQDFTDGSFIYNTHRPVCICSGTLDPNHSRAQRLNDSLLSYGSHHQLNSITDIGHTVNFTGFAHEMLECIQFIDQSVTPVGIPKPKPSASFQLYPNPTNTTLQLNYRDKNLSEVTVLITDIHGKVRYHNQALPLKHATTTIDVRNLASGTYFIHLNTGRTVEVHKLLIAH